MNNYRFNNGSGAVLCCKCNIIIAECISPKEAEYYYGDDAMCNECLIKEQQKEKDNAKD